MLVLAMHDGDDPMMTKEIAERQNLPSTYLEQLMLVLRKAGLVLATRGAKGGYVLAKQSENITLADIVEALEGPLDIADCADITNCCFELDSCALKEVFTEANQALYDVFQRKTLAQLAQDQRTRELSKTPMYYI